MNLPGVPAPYPQPKAPKTRFGHKEDEMLIALKEHWKFSWRQIECFFPGRKQQTLQVRYCTKLKERDVVWDAALVCLSSPKKTGTALIPRIGSKTEKGAGGL
jgi:hypothetical protein